MTLTSAITAPLAVVAMGLACGACVSSDFRIRDWSGYTGPGARHFHAEEFEFPHQDDPLEPFNRLSAAANYGVLRWGVAPLARGWRFIVPRPVRTHLAQAGENLRSPGRLVNNVLQGRLRRGGVELSRFLINGTVGLAGLFDPATAWGLRSYPEDFGQTFATWGWEQSTYLCLPVFGPSSVRDGLGEIPDAFADPLTYFFPAVQARGFNELSNSVDTYLRTIRSTYDAYQAGRMLYSLRRPFDVENYEWRAEENSGATQTLSAIFLAPEDERFGARAGERLVELEPGRPAFPYSVWIQPEPAPLMYVVPGFGGHRLGASSLALAEIAFERGYSVVAISNPTNFEFMRHGASVPVPGYGRRDARDLRRAIEAIDAQLTAEEPVRPLGRSLVGISMGAYYCLRIAAEDRPGGIEFERCLALNPPVDLRHALSQLDRFYNVPLQYSEAEREERLDELFGKVLFLAGGELEPSEPLPFTEDEARFLIGLRFRLDLQFMILQSQALEDFGVLLTEHSRWNAAPAFREAARYSYMEYVYAFVLPYFARNDPDIDFSEAGAETLLAGSSLHSLEAELAVTPGVRVFTNANDFLLRERDLAWLHATLGPRLTLFDNGGHLGNLHRASIQQAIGSQLRNALSTRP